jgi:membrane associated rhomboid family serine protease
MNWSPFVEALFGNFVGSAAGALAGFVGGLFYDAYRRKRDRAEL